MIKTAKVLSFGKPASHKHFVQARASKNPAYPTAPKPLCVMLRQHQGPSNQLQEIDTLKKTGSLKTE